MNLTAHFRKALEDCRDRTVAACAASARAEVDAAAERGRREAFAALGEVLVKALVPALLKSTQWDESKHPRDHGKFSSKEGGSGDAAAGTRGRSLDRPDIGDDEPVQLYQTHSGEVVWQGTHAEAKDLMREALKEDGPNALDGLALGRPGEEEGSQKKPEAKKDDPGSLPPPSDYQTFRTGEPITATVYRGETAGGSGSGMAALGHGRYFGLEPVVAERFSKRGTVRASEVSLQNPVVIHDDAEMVAIKKEAERLTGKDFGRSDNSYTGFLHGNQPAEFTAALQRMGYDGLVTTYKEAPGGQQILVFPSSATVHKAIRFNRICKSLQPDPLSALLKSLAPESPADRLHAACERYGLADQLRYVKAYEAEEYERLLADVTDLWELERITKADRSHLVRKVIRNRLGHRQVVWVKPEEGEEPQRGASRGQADHEGREEGGQAKLTREQAVESRTLMARADGDDDTAAELADLLGDPEHADALLEQVRAGDGDGESEPPAVVGKSAQWDEGKHPRDHGKFASKEGGEGGTTDESSRGGAGMNDDPPPTRSAAPDWLDARKPRFTGPTYYHGTNDEIGQFDDRPTSFSPDEGHSRNFGSNVYEVKVDVRKPVDLTHLGSGAAEAGETDERASGRQVRDALAEYGISVDIPDDVKGWTTDILRKYLPEIFRQGRALGYDGLKVADFKDFEADEVMPFSPKQVKVVAKNGVKAGGKVLDKDDYAKKIQAAKAKMASDPDAVFKVTDAALAGKFGPEAKAITEKATGHGYTPKMIEAIEAALQATPRDA